MTASDFTEKFAELESRIAAEKGDFTLFALFMLEDAPGYWDLMVSASWTGGDEQATVNYFVNQIKASLGEHFLIQLSRIVVIDPQNAGVQALNRKIQIEHGRVEVRDSEFFGVSVKRAYIITSKRSAAAAVV